MKFHALVAAVVLSSTFSLPAFAADAAAAAGTQPTAGAAKSADDQAAANLKSHIAAAKDLLQSIRDLKKKGKAASAAQVAKVRASLAKMKAAVKEAKAEGHAAKSMLLTKMVNSAEKELDKYDASKGAAAPAKP